MCVRSPEVQLADATRLASRWLCPSLRAIALMAIHGARLTWPGLCGPSVAVDPVEELRNAARQAGSVGAVFVERNASNWLLTPMLSRAISDDAGELRVMLQRHHDARLRVLENAYLTNVVPWFVMIGHPQCTATVLGFLAVNGETVRYDFTDGVATARLLVADFVDRGEFEHRGAAMDLDTSVAYVLDELEQIAATTISR